MLFFGLFAYKIRHAVIDRFEKLLFLVVGVFDRYREHRAPVLEVFVRRGFLADCDLELVVGGVLVPLFRFDLHGLLHFLLGIHAG